MAIQGKPIPPASNNATSFCATNSSSSVLNADKTDVQATSSSLSISSEPDEHSPSTIHGESCSRPRTAIGLEDVKWGVYWQQPVLLVTSALCGIALAMGHHFYYYALHGSVVPTSGTQQWPIRFGSAFAFSAISFCKTAITTALTQYTWAILRHKSISIKGIDKAFAITSNPTGIWSFELVKEAKVVVMLAIAIWCLPLAALIPPATLSITASVYTETRPFPVPMLDWASPAWGPGNATYEGTFKPDAVDPSPLIRKIASEAAEGTAVVPLAAPTANSSYSLQFFGPTLQCSDANYSQQAVFDSYMMTYAKQRDTFIFPQLTEHFINITTPYALVFSAFSSTLFNGDQPPNNGIELPPPFFNASTPQLWVQTGNRSIICGLANASFDVGFEFKDGVQNIYQRRIEVVHEMSVLSTCNGVSCVEGSSYFANFLAWTNMLNGNVTMYPGIDGWELVEASSNVLITGLVACDEIAQSCWDSILLQNSSSFHIPNVTNNNFPNEQWECRNRTIDRGIEDLANNITISMLSSSSLTIQQHTSVNFSTTRNQYYYNSHNLIISYAIAIFITLIATGIGLYSFSINGVSHTNSFSAIMTTTRNPDLDTLARGQSLGATPLDADLGRGTSKISKDRVAMHATFGLEDGVSKIRKGDE
ncbi:hypothetical protein N431DRAFT_453756 [Stipitochalara longipes BDJ]|nr:hypothetical protein N431DRAFT_453756 [Stipitochalara longipes BDJ]